jgi:hypothetical protein
MIFSLDKQLFPPASLSYMAHNSNNFNLPIFPALYPPMVGWRFYFIIHHSIFFPLCLSLFSPFTLFTIDIPTLSFARRQNCGDLSHPSHFFSSPAVFLCLPAKTLLKLLRFPD